MSNRTNHRTARVHAAVALAAFMAASGHSVYAQGEYTPLSRAEVNAQARATNQAGMLARGELEAPIQQTAPVSVRSRADRKAETATANREGGLGNSGQRTYHTHNIAPREALAQTTKTRADRKAETMQAIRNHQVVGAGEASM